MISRIKFGSKYLGQSLALGMMVVVLAVSVVAVTQMGSTDIRGRAASGGVYPTPGPSACTTCLKTNTASECRSVCGVNPTPAVISKTDCTSCQKINTASECSVLCQSIGKPYATPLGGKECSPGVSYCSGSTIRVCSSSGTWGITTCQYGCGSSGCNSSSSVTDYNPNALPPDISLINPPNDPMGLTQDPMMAATLNEKAAACLQQYTLAQCTQAMKTAGNDSCVAYSLLDNPSANTTTVKNACNQARAAFAGVVLSVIDVAQAAALADAAQLPSSGTIPINEIAPHEPGYNVLTVQGLKQVIQNGGELDPVDITVYNGQAYTFDGANRITTLAQSGQSSVEYTYTQFSKLSHIDQLLVQQASTGTSITGASIPTSYIDFPPYYYYASGTVRP